MIFTKKTKKIIQYQRKKKCNKQKNIYYFQKLKLN